ncbi:PP2C family protein-serine/threonine phosphatase [Glaciihabitans tibetensis]|uniref:PP2C family protein-serine/threonine phosphatase n=1 Tax=Glaciihabitans tibetensis TaxID=1266600 RepID=UPI0011B1E0E8|nr:SpoIIE family protein phosphatase [Glaciihabitans tibetensis]
MSRTGKRPVIQSLSISAVVLDGASPLTKQIPLVLLFAVAVVMSVITPTLAITSVPALVGAVVLLAGATGFAAVLPRVNPAGSLVFVVPAIDFLVVGVLRFATGESASIFSSLAILPAVWIAASPGGRNVVYAFVGVCGGLLVPFLLGSTLEDNPNELARGLYSACAFTFAAAAVNDLARLARNHISDIQARERVVRVELEQASVVQQALLPTGGIGATGYDIAGVCLPSRAISGDFFDWYKASDGTAFTLGDVMGKGVGAGIIAATVRAVVRSARNHNDLAIALDRASETLASDLADTSTFTTMFHARLDERTGIVRYIDAGHGLSLHVKADGSWNRLSSSDPPIGISVDGRWTVAQLYLAPGDILISCSDGILDLYDGTIESLRNVAEIVSSSADAADVIDRIRAVITTDVTDDDITVLVLRRPGV